jgi:hypothetical protein
MNPATGNFVGGFGAGRGRGWRNRYYATGQFGWQRAPFGGPGAYPPFAPPYPPPVPQLTREQEVDALKEQVRLMQENIDTAQKRIEELVKDKEE